MQPAPPHLWAGHLIIEYVSSCALGRIYRLTNYPNGGISGDIQGSGHNGMHLQQMHNNALDRGMAALPVENPNSVTLHKMLLLLLLLLSLCLWLSGQVTDSAFNQFDFDTQHHTTYVHISSTINRRHKEGLREVERSNDLNERYSCKVQNSTTHNHAEE